MPIQSIGEKQLQKSAELDWPVACYVDIKLSMFDLFYYGISKNFPRQATYQLKTLFHSCNLSYVVVSLRGSHRVVAMVR